MRKNTNVHFEVVSKSHICRHGTQYAEFFINLYKKSDKLKKIKVFINDSNLKGNFDKKIEVDKIEYNEREINTYLKQIALLFNQLSDKLHVSDSNSSKITLSFE